MLTTATDRFARSFGVDRAELIDTITGSESDENLLYRNADVMKANRSGTVSFPGIGGKRVSANPLMGFVEGDLTHGYSYAGVRERGPRYSYNVLREMERKNGIVSTCTNHRARQVRQFTKTLSTDADEPGHRIRLHDRDAKPTRKQQETIKRMQEWLFETGNREPRDEHNDRTDNFVDFGTKYVRENITIDRVAVELQRDRMGNGVAFWALDGASIKRVSARSGFRGSKSDITPQSFVYSDDRRLVKLKERMIPEPSDIRFVQVEAGRFVAAFTHDDLILDVVNHRVDLRWAGEGYSLIEQAMTMVTAFLWGVAYNAEIFNSGTIPKMALAFEGQQYDRRALESLQDEMIANFQGIGGAFRMPLFQGKVTAIDLMKSPRDMEYMKYLEFAGSLTASILGVDLSEVGLHFQQGAKGGMGGGRAINKQQQFSRDKGLLDILSSFAGLMNKIMRLIEWSDEYVFEFTGIVPEDREKTSRLRKEAVETYKTVNEVRAKEDLPPVKEGGDVVLNPQLIQLILAERQAAQAEQQDGGFDDEEMDSMIDESLDGVFKARESGARARTLLVV